jgi:REP element-mobilizing transposase RayT
LQELTRQTECRMVERRVMTDPMHVCIESPPKHSVATAIGCIKDKSAIATAR